MYDVGETYPATVEVKDSSGNPVNAATMAFTFTLPDGTSTPVTPSNPSTGRYEHDLPINQYGLHRFRAVSTGPNTAYADAFNVADSTWPAFVGLAETKNHLNIAADNTTYDEELRGFILSASEVVEDIVGTVARRTYVETYSGRGQRAILLRHQPVISVTSVAVDGETVLPADYSVTPSGVLSRLFGRWPSGVDNITVTYVPGRTATPASVLDAAKELIRINWRPQQGGNYSPFDQGRADDFGTPTVGEVRLGFFVPNTVMQRLQPHARGPLVA